jgi:uncharacterized cupredoxin-like copper-binding protein
MFRFTSRLLLLALVLTLTLAACGGTAANPTAPKTVTLTLNEFQFQPADITVNVGQPITLVLKNNGTVLHDFVSMDAKVEVTEEHGAMHDMAGMAEPAMHAAVEAGQESTIKFKATQAGTYTFNCSVAGHKEAGMVGKLIVK